MLLHFGLQVVLAIVSIVLPVLIGSLLRRYNIQVQSQQYTAAVASAINAVEQIAASKLKAGQPPDSSAAKLTKAIEIANSLIKDFKLKELAAEKLSNLIEAKLGEKSGVATTPAPAPTATPATPQVVDAEDPK
jgi:type II secretory pathway pseudopilin PulG